MFSISPMTETIIWAIPIITSKQRMAFKAGLPAAWPPVATRTAQLRKTNSHSIVGFYRRSLAEFQVAPFLLGSAQAWLHKSSDFVSELISKSFQTNFLVWHMDLKFGDIGEVDRGGILVGTRQQ